MRRGDRRLGSGRRRRRRRPGRRRARRDRGRVGRLLRRSRTSTARSSRRDHPLLHGRAERDPRPERRAARRLLPGRRHGGQLLDLVPHPRRRPRRVGVARRARRSPPRSTPQSLDAVCERLGVNQEHNEPSTREQKLQEGCVKLGWHVDAMPRGVRHCAQGKECGYCGLGCRVGAKQSVVKTWLADAHAAGTRLIVRTKVQRVLVRGRRGRGGSSGRTAEGHRADRPRPGGDRRLRGDPHAGAAARSGLQNPNIGKHLKLHPASAVFGVFDEELKPWEGVMQALYSDQHRDLHDGYGLKYETAAEHPHLFIPFSPWRGSREHFGADGGAVEHGADRRAAARPRRGRGARRPRRRAGCPLQALGLRRRPPAHRDRRRRPDSRGSGRSADLLLAGPKWVGYEPGRREPAGRFMADADAAGYGAGQVTLGSFHIMGSARMGGSRHARPATPPARRGMSATCTCSTARLSPPRPASTRRSRSSRSRTWAREAWRRV